VDTLPAPGGGVRYVLQPDLRPGAAVRSAMLPGWGQRHKGERTRGWILTSAWAAAAAGAVGTHIGREDAKGRYEQARDPAEIEARYATYNTWHRTRNTLVLGAAAVWTASFVDALTGNPAGAAPGFSAGFAPIPGAAILRFSYTF
jgi:hypothetical protein